MSIDAIGAAQNLHQQFEQNAKGVGKSQPSGEQGSTTDAVIGKLRSTQKAQRSQPSEMDKHKNKMTEELQDPAKFMKILGEMVTSQGGSSDSMGPEKVIEMIQTFASSQQLSQVNENISGMRGDIQGLTNRARQDIIGRGVEVDNTVIDHAFPGRNETLTYTMPEGAEHASLRVLDMNGNTIYEATDVPAEAGTNTFSWDGTNAQGRTAPAGQYRFVVAGETASGQAVCNNTTLVGLVEASDAHSDRIQVEGRTFPHDAIQRYLYVQPIQTESAEQSERQPRTSPSPSRTDPSKADVDQSGDTTTWLQNLMSVMS